MLFDTRFRPLEAAPLANKESHDSPSRCVHFRHLQRTAHLGAIGQPHSKSGHRAPRHVRDLRLRFRNRPIRQGDRRLRRQRAQAPPPLER
jgi:hypothetical protein